MSFEKIKPVGRGLLPDEKYDEKTKTQISRGARRVARRAARHPALPRYRRVDLIPVRVRSFVSQAGLGLGRSLGMRGVYCRVRWDLRARAMDQT